MQFNVIAELTYEEYVGKVDMSKTYKIKKIKIWKVSFLPFSFCHKSYHHLL